jgi:two-component system sporulation sensor kinase C
MDYIYLSKFGSISGTVSILLTYVYLYALYRERYMGTWAVAWFIFFLRLIIFDSGMFDWKQSIWGFIIFQFLFISCALLFIRSAYLFIDKNFGNIWIYSAVSACVLSTIVTLSQSSLAYRVFFPSLFSAIVCIGIGIIFLRCLKLKGIGKTILGYAFILWGLLTLVLPFLASTAWFITWSSLFGGILRLIIAASTLLVYFEKIRSDLVEKETKYRLLAENAIDIIYRYKLVPSARIEYISPAVFAVTGYTPEEYYSDVGLMSRVIHPNDLPLFDSFFTKPLLNDEVPITLRLIRKDLKSIWVEQKHVPIYDEAGKVCAFEGIIRDVTARKELEHIIARFDRINMVGEMAVSVAHEIRNPLTTARGYLQFLQRKPECNQYKDRYDLIIKELDNANMIVSEYLLLAKDKVADLKYCSLNIIITVLLPLLQATAIAYNVYIKLDLKDIPELYLDENEIRQLLLNLVRNGAEAMPKGGELVIRTFQEGNQAALSISDSGPGIPPHILENLGMPFMTTKNNGTGLGLPICYRIANRHNAVIRVKTDSAGTTFYIFFNLITIAA